MYPFFFVVNLRLGEKPPYWLLLHAHAHAHKLKRHPK